MKFNETKYKDLTGQDITLTSMNLGGKGIDSLEGCPEIFRGDLHLFTNDLENLKFAPKEIYGAANFSDNLLTSLKGSLETVVGNLNISDNKLEDFKGNVRKVTGNLYVEDLRAFRTLDEIEIALMAGNITVGGEVITSFGTFKQNVNKMTEFAKSNRIGILGDFL